MQRANSRYGSTSIAWSAILNTKSASAGCQYERKRAFAKRTMKWLFCLFFSSPTSRSCAKSMPPRTSVSSDAACAFWGLRSRWEPLSELSARMDGVNHDRKQWLRGASSAPRVFVGDFALLAVCSVRAVVAAAVSGREGSFLLASSRRLRSSLNGLTAKHPPRLRKTRNIDF